MIDKITYVNVNEDGEVYRTHDTLPEALAVQDEFPNDRIEVRRERAIVYNFYMDIQVKLTPEADPLSVQEQLREHIKNFGSIRNVATGQIERIQ